MSLQCYIPRASLRSALLGGLFISSDGTRRLVPDHWLLQAELLEGDSLLRLSYTGCTIEVAGQALKAISEKKAVAIVIDQNVRAGARVFLEFFGRPASTTPTLALLALKTGAPIVPVFSFPGPRGSYRIVYGPEVVFQPTGDRDRDVRALTERCTRIIEDQIRARPEFWLWLHERWKSRPRNTEWPPRWDRMPGP